MTETRGNTSPSIERKILLTDCADAQGLIAKITSVCFTHKLNIIKNSEFVDNAQGRFFMRTELEGIFNSEQLLQDLRDVLPTQNHMTLVSAGKKRIVVLVTKEAHCLGDLLMKAYYGGLSVEIAAVVGNHDALRELAEKFNIPFHLVSHEGLERIQHEQVLLAAVSQYEPDYLVLAKYMRVLTPDFVAQYPNRIINIHHSFLPSFVGARPYHQAWDKGVKLIGATCHYVTADLDEGPIIEQDVIRIDHSDAVEDMVRYGKDIEKTVLARGLRYHLEDRVLVHGNKTVVFR